MSANRDRRRFTIEDAFEEETDDAIRVYGSTTERSPLKPKVRNNGTIPEDSIVVRIDNAEPRSPVPLKSPDDVSLTPTTHIGLSISILKCDSVFIAVLNLPVSLKFGLEFSSQCKHGRISSGYAFIFRYRISR
jgi:hypothetical protein